ncbi:MAG TPA: isocitrate/isopropylmalate family dehydrogenase [Gaiellaceae bacterium]|nr:isocitrate/isopropylmalate family dehydrogenase [Gaiellaceae bacterium]
MKIACLTGAGTAPELMAEAVLALDRVARLHNLHVEETHATFGGGAFARAGQSVPPSTRAAILDADAVLVAGADEPALEEVTADLDLRAQATRVRFGHHDDVVVVAPRTEDACEWAAERAFAIAEQRTLRLAAVGDGDWRELVDDVAAHHDHVTVEHVAPKLAIPLAAFTASRFDVVAVSPQWAEPMGEILAASAAARVAAHGLLAEHGPSLFVPAPNEAGSDVGRAGAARPGRLAYGEPGGYALAGAGVVNPSSMLLAAATMLDFGLGHPVAASTLAGAVSAALVDGPQTPDLLRRGVGATTREFTTRVIAGFQLSQPWGSAA